MWSRKMFWGWWDNTCWEFCRSKRDIGIINLELVLADLEIVENRIGKIEKKAQTTKEKTL